MLDDMTGCPEAWAQVQYMWLGGLTRVWRVATGDVYGDEVQYLPGIDDCQGGLLDSWTPGLPTRLPVRR